MDVDLVENLRKNLTNDGSADKQQKRTRRKTGVHMTLTLPKRASRRTGWRRDSFRSQAKDNMNMLFQLHGRQTMNGRDVYHVSFRPKDKRDFDWKGEAFIDTSEFEPVVVYTKMSRKIPLAVRTLLGTDLPGLGFSVTYARQPDGVWFPVSFGTEFRMRVLFFIARDISMSLTNTHFEKTHADVRILEGVKVVENAAPAAAATPSLGFERFTPA